MGQRTPFPLQVHRLSIPRNGHGLSIALAITWGKSLTSTIGTDDEQ